MIYLFIENFLLINGFVIYSMVTIIEKYRKEKQISDMCAVFSFATYGTLLLVINIAVSFYVATSGILQ